MCCISLPRQKNLSFIGLKKLWRWGGDTDSEYPTTSTIKQVPTGITIKYMIRMIQVNKDRVIKRRRKNERRKHWEYFKLSLMNYLRSATAICKRFVCP